MPDCVRCPEASTGGEASSALASRLAIVLYYTILYHTIPYHNMLFYIS